MVKPKRKEEKRVKTATGRIQSSKNFVPADADPRQGLGLPHRYIVVKTVDAAEAIRTLNEVMEDLEKNITDPLLIKQALEALKKAFIEKDKSNPFYFTLRLDPRGDDPIWTSCCRAAVNELIDELDAHQHLPQLADDLEELLKKFEDQIAKQRKRYE